MTLHIVDTDGHWMTSPDWRRVVDIALYQAASVRNLVAQ